MFIQWWQDVGVHFFTVTLAQYSVPSMSLFHNNLPKYSQNYVTDGLVVSFNTAPRWQRYNEPGQAVRLLSPSPCAVNDGRRRRTASHGRPRNLMIISSN